MFWTRKDETGNRYGKLRVTAFASVNKQGCACWECDCDCGGHTVASGHDLRRGHTTTCGCAWTNAFVEVNRKKEEVSCQQQQQ